MRHYEIMIILEPELEERTVAPSLDTFLNVIRQAGGSVDRVDVWGRRRLAYEIDKRNDGIYAVVDVTSEPDAVRELDRQLRLNEAVMRTKVLQPPSAARGAAPDRAQGASGLAAVAAASRPAPRPQAAAGAAPAPPAADDGAATASEAAAPPVEQGA